MLSILALCHLSHPRFWLQELLCSASLYWIPFVVLGLMLAVWRLLHRRRVTLLLLFAIITQLYLVGRVGGLLLPYIYQPRSYASKASATTDLSIFFSQVDFASEGLAVLQQVIREKAPALVILLGSHTELNLAERALANFPSKLRTPETGARGILILSQIPFEDPPRDNLGYDALPGVYLRLVMPGGMRTAMGVVDLLPAISPEAFSRSKITSRRLATLMRYGKEPRIVVGGFEATPFSPIVSMYSGQVGLRSVRNNMKDLFLYRTIDNTFVSKQIAVESFSAISGVSRQHRSFQMVLRISSGIIPSVGSPSS